LWIERLVELRQFAHKVAITALMRANPVAPE
jgi:hypothetical protein